MGRSTRINELSARVFWKEGPLPPEDCPISMPYNLDFSAQSDNNFILSWEYEGIEFRNFIILQKEKETDWDELMTIKGDKRSAKIYMNPEGNFGIVAVDGSGKRSEIAMISLRLSNSITKPGKGKDKYWAYEQAKARIEEEAYASESPCQFIKITTMENGKLKSKKTKWIYEDVFLPNQLVIDFVPSSVKKASFHRNENGQWETYVTGHIRRND